MNQNEYDVLKKEVDALQIQMAEQAKPWYRKPSNLIAILALLLSFLSTLASAYISNNNDMRNNRRETGVLLQRLARLPIEQMEIQQRYRQSPVAVRMSAMLNQENAILAVQSAANIDLFPKSFTAVEYVAVGAALKTAGFLSKAEEFYSKGLEKADDVSGYIFACHELGSFHFIQGNHDTGREYFQKALDAWEQYPGPIPLYRYATDIHTLVTCAELESMVMAPDMVKMRLAKARQLLPKVPDPMARDSLGQRISALENKMH